MKEKYLNTKLEIKDERDERFMLVMKVKECDDYVGLSLASLTSEFKPFLMPAFKKKWPNKMIQVDFTTDVSMDYHSYREFRRNVFKLVH